MLFASDLDHGRNAKINYRLQSPSETFHVERDTGALVVSSTIDRESIATYILTVREHPHMTSDFRVGR